MLGHTFVSYLLPRQQVTLLSCGEIYDILNEGKAQGPSEAKSFIARCVDSCHRGIYEKILAFLGEEMRISGSLGNPAILPESLYLVKEATENALIRSFDSYYDPLPFNKETEQTRALTLYLYFFVGNWASNREALSPPWLLTE